jgi:hypothetical protein
VQKRTERSFASYKFVTHASPWNEKVACTCPQCDGVQFGCLASGYIIGLPKAGSSAAYNMLQQHPNVVTARKEMLVWARGPRPEAFKDYMERYGRLLSQHENGIVVDGSILYFTQTDGIPQLMHNFHSEARFIVILRDPLERMWSEWKYFCEVDTPCSSSEMLRSFREMNEKIRECVCEKEPCIRGDDSWPIGDVDAVQRDYWRCFEPAAAPARDWLVGGIYWHHFIRWFVVYPENQFLFVAAEELRHDPEGITSLMYEFLGLAPHRLEVDDIEKTGVWGLNIGV